MKKVIKPTLKEQIDILANRIKYLINLLYALQTKNNRLKIANANLHRDKAWLKRVIQEMSLSQ